MPVYNCGNPNRVITFKSHSKTALLTPNAIFFNIAVHYSNCVQLRDAGNTNTGQYTLLDLDTPLPAYCDQDYMGGGRFDFLGEIPYLIPGKLILTYFATTQCIMNVKTNLDDCIKDHGPVS